MVGADFVERMVAKQQGAFDREGGENLLEWVFAGAQQRGQLKAGLMLAAAELLAFGNMVGWQFVEMDEEAEWPAQGASILAKLLSLLLGKK